MEQSNQKSKQKLCKDITKSFYSYEERTTNGKLKREC